MVLPFTHVEPGDLITSFDWNAVIDELNSLEARVTTLEVGAVSPTAPHITGYTPAGDFVDPGRLTLTGNNFDVPVSGNTVNLDGLHLSTFVFGSDDQNLTFDVSPLAGLPKDVQVSVQNSHGLSNVITIHMKAPDVVLTGTADIAKVVQNLPAVQIGSATTFIFLVHSVTNGPITFSLAANYSSVNGASASAWAGATTFVDPNTSNPFANSKVTINSGQATPIGVRVVPPAGAVSAQLALHISPDNSTDSRLTQTSAAIPITIGQPYQDNPNAPSFTVSGSGVVVKKVTIDHQDIWQVKHGATGALIKLAAVYGAGGNYTFDATITGTGGVFAFSDPSEHVSPPSVTAAVRGHTQQLTVSVDNTAASATSDTWLVTVTANKTNSDGDSGPFASSFSFLIGLF
jgi:hypothetical protein